MSMNAGLPDNNISGIVIAGSKVFASTDSSGVFISTNSGVKWYPLSRGLPNPYVSCLVANSEYLYAGIVGGLWRMPLNDAVASVGAEAKGMAVQFQLEQNYPNPFNPSTTITFELPKTSQVTLTVYDILGREVSVLVNERKSAGVHDVKFDASGLSSGVYFYRLQAGDFTQTRKLCLIR